MIQRDTAGGPATRSVRLYYDVENRWIGQTIDADGAGTAAALQVTAFAYQGTQIALQYEGTVADDGGVPAEALQAGDLTHRYLWGPAVDQILADEQVESLDETGQVVWPLADPIGTVRDLVLRNAETGIAAVANHRVYDSFGNLQSETDAAVDCLFASAGRPFDPTTGLQNNWNRWYDPELRRWASEDPIGLAGGDGNLHRYCRNDGANNVDSTGTDWWNPFTWWDVDWSEQLEQEAEIVLELNRLFGTKHTNLASFAADERAQIEAAFGQEFDWDAASASRQVDRALQERLGTLDHSETALRVAEASNDAAGLILGGQQTIKVVKAVRAARAAKAGPTALAVAEEATATLAKELLFTGTTAAHMADAARGEKGARNRFIRFRNLTRSTRSHRM